MSKQDAKNIFKDGETTWEEKTMRDYTDIVYKDISDSSFNVFYGRVYNLTNNIDDKDLYFVYFDGETVQGDSPTTGWVNSWGFNTRDSQHGIQYAFPRYGEYNHHWVRVKEDGEWKKWRRI